MKPRWLSKALNWKEGLDRYKYVLLVAAAGLVLMALPTKSGPEPPALVQTGEHSEVFVLEIFEEKLAGTLSQIQGAGQTRVVLTLDSGSRQILAQDQQRDGAGSTSAETVTVGRGSGTQEVVPLQILAPSFRGALIVSPGGGDPQVKLLLTQAVSALTGLGADRISICQGNG